MKDLKQFTGTLGEAIDMFMADDSSLYYHDGSQILVGETGLKGDFVIDICGRMQHVISVRTLFNWLSVGDVYVME